MLTQISGESGPAFKKQYPIPKIAPWQIFLVGQKIAGTVAPVCTLIRSIVERLFSANAHGFNTERALLNPF